MKLIEQRRQWLKMCGVLPFAGLIAPSFSFARGEVSEGQLLKTSLNAYSFNEPLMNKTMSLEDLLVFASLHHFDGIDLTGYYFPSYPAVPSDEFIYYIKRKAHLLGLSVSGMGVRNDFTQHNRDLRRLEVERVKNWIIVAAKMGAPVLRVFSGVIIPKDYSWMDIATWMAEDLKECADFGQKYGVIVGLQNHNDFIKTAEEVHKIFDMVRHEWLGLVLDIGSYRTGDPYEQIKSTIPLAVNWQIKENIFENGIEKKVDLAKLFNLIKNSTYKGYIPIETLGKGDPNIKVAAFKREVDFALSTN
ncbi:MAG: sugar phosphate isomerase/epimerase [Saprospiraceae bacterium]|nr:sugar phosphate isomerase/epimerase [Saprospiraceae bacterium]